VKCRPVKKCHTYCAQVPCTKWVKETVVEKIPYTVCKKVPCTTVQQVPCTTTRNVMGAYVDCNGCTFDCDGPGRCFKEGAQVCTKVPYTVCKTVNEVVKKQVPYTVTRCVKGAYVDCNGQTYDCEG